MNRQTYSTVECLHETDSMLACMHACCALAAASLTHTTTLPLHHPTLLPTFLGGQGWGGFWEEGGRDGGLELPFPSPALLLTTTTLLSLLTYACLLSFHNKHSLFAFSCLPLSSMPSSSPAHCMPLASLPPLSLRKIPLISAEENP